MRRCETDHLPAFAKMYDLNIQRLLDVLFRHAELDGLIKYGHLSSPWRLCTNLCERGGLSQQLADSKYRRRQRNKSLDPTQHPILVWALFAPVCLNSLSVTSRPVSATPLSQGRSSHEHVRAQHQPRDQVPGPKAAGSPGPVRAASGDNGREEERARAAPPGSTGGSDGMNRRLERGHAQVRS